MNTPETNKCPVCNRTDLEDFEVCPVCEWQNDQYQRTHPDAEGCANNMSLNQAREAYRKGEKIH